MDTNIVIAISTISGVAVSVVAAIVASLWQTEREIIRIRQEFQLRYTDKLAEKRLQQYPELYGVLSSVSKKIETGELTKADLMDTLAKLNDCDSRISLLFSDKTSVVSFRLRDSLTKITQLSNAEFLQQLAAGNRHTKGSLLSKLDSETGQLELALKTDLGVFAVEFSDLSRRFASYEDMTKTIDQVRQ